MLFINSPPLRGRIVCRTLRSNERSRKKVYRCAWSWIIFKSVLRNRRVRTE
jgi:hypothetical protein